MELSAHQMSLEPFGAYGCCYLRHHRQQEMELGTQPLSYTLTRQASNCGGDGDGDDDDGGNRGSCDGANARWGPGPSCYYSRAQDPCPGTTAAGHDSSPQGTSNADAAVATAHEQPSSPSPEDEEEGKEEEEGEEEEEGRQTASAVAAPPAPCPPCCVLAPPAIAAATPPPLALQHAGAKRPRAADDVDGEGTATLSSKKRRLLLRLVTSRLSRPFSLPATHILIRESGRDTTMPALHRIQRLASLGSVRRAITGGGGGGGGAALLVRKAAILNRVRHLAAGVVVARGHMAGAAGGGVWRPQYAAGFHPRVALGQHQQHQQQSHYCPPPYQQQQNYGVNATTTGGPDTRWASGGGGAHTSSAATTHHPRQKETPATGFPPPIADADASDEDEEEEDNTAFPAAGFHDRYYAELSDDDVDDVYADFGVLFGNPGGGGSSSPAEEPSYEEYLDELDGIPWVF
ncbi:hypothetical protein SAMD00023353_1700190 [Rosellinia necatrix]|uniref:Uncharacterized protein n=1 Tax=Rosellinia necatrix TaxID=77044 RepID=A0A1W2TKV0_ROSNE|nr:hypothetical protein SAMD00023353_1700190 [Rosellinia necatrix]